MCTSILLFVSFLLSFAIVWALVMVASLGDLFKNDKMKENDNDAIEYSEMPGNIDNIRHTLKGKK